MVLSAGCIVATRPVQPESAARQAEKRKKRKRKVASIHTSPMRQPIAVSTMVASSRRIPASARSRSAAAAPPKAAEFSAVALALTLVSPVCAQHFATGAMEQVPDDERSGSVEVVAYAPSPIATRLSLDGAVGVRSMRLAAAAVEGERQRYSLEFRSLGVRYLRAETPAEQGLELPAVPIRGRVLLPPIPRATASVVELAFDEAWLGVGGNGILASSLAREGGDSCRPGWSTLPVWHTFSLRPTVRIERVPAALELWFFHPATGAIRLGPNFALPSVDPRPATIQRDFQLVSSEPTESLQGVVTWGKQRVPIARVGASGRFSVVGPPGPWELSVFTFDGNEVSWTTNVTEAALDIVTVPLPGRARLAGQLLTPAGEPVGGALIWRAGEANWQVVTRRDGSFGLRDLPTQRSLRLCIQLESGQLFSQEAEGLPAGVSSLQIVVPTEAATPAPELASVSGRAVNESGEPLSGIKLRLVRDQGSREVIRAMVRPRSGSALANATSDVLGVFELSSALEPGRYRVVADSSDYAPTSSEPIEIFAPGDRVDLGDLVLKHGAVVRGKVLTARGEPSPGMKVTVAVGVDGAWLQLASHAITSERGEFEIDGIPESVALEVRAERDGGEAVAKRLSETDDPLNLTLVLGPSRSIAVVAWDSDGLPVEGADVSLRSPTGRARDAALPGRIWRGTTDPSGTTRLEGVDCGPQNLIADAKGFLRFAAELPASECSSKASSPVIVTLARGVEISGRVLAADGSAVPGAWVMLDGTGVTTDPAGWYRLRCATGELVRLRYSDNGRDWIAIELAVGMEDVRRDLILP